MVICTKLIQVEERSYTKTGIAHVLRNALKMKMFISIKMQCMKFYIGILETTDVVSNFFQKMVSLVKLLFVPSFMDLLFNKFLKNLE